MKILIGCECSGVVREAFRRRGHEAWSCDLKPAEDLTDFHIRGDVIAAIQERGPWDLGVFFPECRFLCSSGLHWNTRRPERAKETEKAFRFAMELRRCADKHLQHWALENSIGCLSTRWRSPDQIIQPHQFGHDAAKGTCLWLSGLPTLRGTKRIAPRWVCKHCDMVQRWSLKDSDIFALFGCPLCGGKLLPRWANQTDSGQNRLGPSPSRSEDRARTYPGVAEAMAEQWGDVDKHPVDLFARVDNSNERGRS